MTRVTVACVFTASCASATNAHAPDGGGIQLDAPHTTPADAPRLIDAPRAVDAPRPIDAPADAAGVEHVLLTQTLTTTIGSSSLGCQDLDLGGTYEQAYYRVFSVTNTLQLSSVMFGVLSVSSPLTITVNVGSYGATPGTTINVGSADWGGGDVTAIATGSAALDAGSAGTVVSVPITAAVPAGNLIVEIHAPDESTDNDASFFLGASADHTEFIPGYFWSPACGVTPPGTPASLGSGTVPFIIMASGTES